MENFYQMFLILSLINQEMNIKELQIHQGVAKEYIQKKEEELKIYIGVATLEKWNVK